MAEIRCSCFCLLLLAGILVAATAQTDLGDVGALTALMRLWGNTVPPSWGKGDPCSSEWEGVGCTGSRVTTLKLSSMGLEGDDIGDIGSLTQLEVLDLSSNPDLTASIPSTIGNLANLTTLILAACNFTGSIPEELGKLEKLTFLALNDNKLTGHIPSSFGSLSNIYWLDFADNMLNGPLPVSNGSIPGLDKLLKAKHFHFSRNQLSGSVPDSLFSPKMVLKHILFDGNKFSGPIPRTVGQLNASLLEVLRLDRNNFYGTVPDDLSNLTHLNELNLSSNQLTGPVPNLTLMNVLYSVDLSNNLFGPSVAPSWFTTIQSLRTLVLQHGKLEGEVPQGLFSLPYLQRVNLKNNLFNGTLDMGGSIPPSLQYVDLENNQISVVSGNWNVTVTLDGNPVCSRDRSRCSQPTYEQPKAPYITSLANCMSTRCPGGEKLNPQSCLCAHPYRGYMQFRAIGFSDLSNATAFRGLERMLCDNLGLEFGSVYLENPVLDETGVVQLHTFLFPSTGLEYFNRSEISRMGFALNNHTVKIPSEFGPYFFKAYPYLFPAVGKGRGSGAIIGIAVGCSVLVLALLALAGYAIQQKRRADKAAIETSRPFASWGGTSCKDSGDAPQLKGAQWFSFDEVKKFTNNFSASNEIGSGGYGKVYRGTLPNGQMVAIKRASQGSMQGGVEFKTEIELLSRVHHRNLVSLVGFCFDRGEQILVYEFVPNGTLRDSLSGRSGIRLDWKRRLRVSLGSARGLAYLHELANPPIIHRDVKTTNILLDESLVAKVADFGLSKLVADSEKGHVSTQVKGTLGYLDPEYYMTQKLTEKSDVYSFGVVMLELVTGKPPIERGKYVVREVRLAIDKRKKACGLEELLDPAIKGIAPSGFDKFVDLAMRCVEESASDRPSMGEVVKEIETILHNEGVNTNPASASSSANDFGTSTGVPLRHPYNDPMPAQGSDEFSHSSVYTVPTRIEPK